MAATSISSNLRRFLDEHIKSAGDLSAAPSLVAQLRDDHRRLETHLLDLLHTLSSPSISNWESLSQAARDSLSLIRLQFRRSQSNDEGRTGGFSLLGKEMSQLAGEVGRIHVAHQYIGTALHLETLVGDLEDATLSYMAQNSGIIIAQNSDADNPTDLGVKQEDLQTCIRAMNHIEEFLEVVTQNHPQWNRLLTVIDSRVAKTIGILRPQAIREYQAILSSCGWPPPLSSLLEKERKEESSNPLQSLQGSKWHQFSNSFLCLCALQHQQDCQKERRLKSLAHQRKIETVSLEMSNSTFYLGDNLWAIDVLVSPLVPRLEHHFSKWSNEPKFVFALIYKISKEFLEPIDNLLQPLMDKARLVKCSAKESWVSAMVKVLSSYLKANVFPTLSESYEADLQNVDIISSWLTVIDLIIESDKRMQALASAGVRVKDSISEFEGSILNLLASIFQDHPEWLQIWSEIELRDVEEKLKLELEDCKAWKIERVAEEAFIDKKDEFLSSTREDYRAPPVADSVIRTALTIIERGRALPSMAIRVEFIKSSACILMNWFYKVLLQRCEETKSTVIAMEEESMLKLVNSVNAARYCETVMQGWTEDATFLEIENDRDVANFSVRNERKAKSTLFEAEIDKMIKLETDCILDMVSSLLHQFDFCSRNYMQEKRYLYPELDEIHPDEEHLDVSRDFVEALNILDGWLRFLKCSLNFRDFADLWRSLAGGLDHFILNSVILGDVRYGHAGTKQFKVDMKALYLVFKPFCIRPEAFFPCINDSLKLLAIPSEDVDLLMADPSKREKMQDFLKSHGIFHLTPKQAKRILGRTKARNRSRLDAV